MNPHPRYLAPEISSYCILIGASILAASYGSGTPGVFNEETDTDNYGEF